MISLTALPNTGQEMERKLKSIGITTVEEQKNRK